MAVGGAAVVGAARSEPRATVYRPRRLVPISELVAVAALCVLGDLFLYGGLGGVGLACFLLSAPLMIVIGAEDRRRSIRLAGVTALLGVVAVRSAWAYSPGAALLGFALLLAFALSLSGRPSFVPEFLLSAVASLHRSVTNLGDQGTSLIARVTRGRMIRWTTIFVPLAAVVLFVAIFAAANPVVERLFADLPSLLFSDPTGAFARVCFWATMAFVAAMLLRPEFVAPGFNHRLGPDHAQAALAADRANDTAFQTARNLLWAVNAVFLAYNAVDVAYLWAGEPPAGIDHTVYAHRGTLWLTIGLALTTVVIGYVFRGARFSGPRAARLRRLALAWSAQGFVLAAGTLRRIQIYVDYSGLTYLRVVGLVGTALVIAGLAMVTIKVVRGRTMLWLLRRQLDALVLAAAFLVAAPIDVYVASFNADRVSEGEYRPILNLFTQETPPAALPSLLQLLEHEDPAVRSGIAAFLTRELVSMEFDDRYVLEQTWTTRELSRGYALEELRAVRPELDRLIGFDPDSVDVSVEDTDGNVREIEQGTGEHWDLLYQERLDRAATGLGGLRRLAREANELSPGDRDY